MKKSIIFLFTPFVLFAQVYMAKIEPYDEFTIYSQASGQIIKLDKSDETKTVSKVLIKQDDLLERQKLKLYKTQLQDNKIKLKLMKENYSKFLKIRGKSKVDKDEKYYQILDLEININSLEMSIKELEDTIRKKTISVNNLYIKEFLVNKGDYVSTGTQLAKAYDTTKSKLIVYVSEDDYKDIKTKKVLINNKESIATIEKIDKTLDEKYVSAHKVTIVINNANFGKVLSVEFVK
ncbi:hypothetical protein CPU12_04495 [Malaciobacter molluscorum LMG 25693]|uniref:RND family efflux system, membrane fusion protein n=1 Tax=Malaciobacter molluscorum LMG 25693 TaxID=870501 RepID=A0A2G1DJ70_9BACT|nr:HlyD family efflux transporter periplasmic adaptor subunit [Malaciobacter molluscorum]AXX91661.1 RND family efflux system, membrane fusion protein [Malaciobacter molluscorum LMG 25693]PHO18545.1 hypothetical protein CPU12_04495 [Malaciobacter molluscorum LMG 25693]RXJ94626.1 hypothetical protein CRV00_06780 [Malaciobacter molluscorum]